MASTRAEAPGAVASSSLASSSSSPLNLDTAKRLQSLLESTDFNIVEAKTRYKSKPTDVLEDFMLGGGAVPGEGGPALKSPKALAGDVAAQMSFLRKLKFQYLEQHAKDKYIKIIVNDEAPLITADDNEELKASNDKKKAALKAAKARLAERHADVRSFAPLVEDDYNKARAMTAEATNLTQAILDARLKLTRIKQAHPPPRLTITTAERHLEEQEEEMQKLDDELAEANEKVASVKEGVKDGTRDVERLRAERAEVEREVRVGRREGSDGRVVGRHDWFRALLVLKHKLTDLHSFTPVSDNEVHLTYHLSPPSSPKRPREVTIVLLFVPNSRQLAEARIEGLPSQDECTETIAAHVQANDPAGLVWTLLAKAREDVARL